MTLITDAGKLLRSELYQHIEAAEYLVDAPLPWPEDRAESIAKAVADMSLVIRTAIHDHTPGDYEYCPTCRTPWPCDTVRAIHRTVMNPDQCFRDLVAQERER